MLVQAHFMWRHWQFPPAGDEFLSPAGLSKRSHRGHRKPDMAGGSAVSFRRLGDVAGIADISQPPVIYIRAARLSQAGDANDARGAVMPGIIAMQDSSQINFA